MDIDGGFFDALYPDDPIDLVEWSDTFRILTSDASAESGKWRTERTPYLREIMEALSPMSPVTDIWVQKGAQLGFTEMGVNWVGYVISHCPGPMLFVQPTAPMIRRTVKQRIDPMIDSVPEVSEKLPDRYAKSGGNSATEKLFPGGALILSGANSAAALCSIPIRFAALDEVDRMPRDVGNEGDPIGLARARTRTFPNAKRLYFSTPTIAGFSRIEDGYNNTDKRKFFVPCPHCGEFQTIEWGRIHWDDQDRHLPAWLECAVNGCVIEETNKPVMLRAGQWRPTDEDHANPKVRGYHISSLYSPLGWYSWSEARDEFLASEGKSSERKTWTNTVLGETHKDRGDAPNWEKLYARRDNNPVGIIPSAGRLLLAGVDVQKDRLECTVWAFGENLWSHTVDHLIFAGDTQNTEGPHSPWVELDRVLAHEFPHELGGALAIRVMAVDSGYNTQSVYRWARRHDRRRVAIVKGRDTLDAAVSSPTHQDVKENGKRIRRGVMVWPVGVSLLKGELYDALRRPAPPPGDPLPTRWVSFPQLSDEFFKQLCAEELVTRVNRRGYVVQEWRKTRDRNEALDCAVYARAASIIAGLDRMTPKHFEQIRQSLTSEDKPEPQPQRDRAKRRDRSIWSSRND